MENYKILAKTTLAEKINEYVIFAPMVAKHCLAGQFVILRTDNDGERVPFTICDYDREKGTVSILVQEVGFTTQQLASMNVGDSLSDFVGPLGNATDLSEYKNILLVGGGVGTAVIFPQAKQLCTQNKSADVILGARNKNLFLYENQFKKYAKNVYTITDDGSNGKKGFVTDEIKRLFAEGKSYDCVFAVGPLNMMRAVCNLTKEYSVKTIISMNSMMVDGTGMCGCCRLSYDGNIKYACIDGPEFDGHLVDFDEAISRGKIYREQELKHSCNIRG